MLLAHQKLKIKITKGEYDRIKNEFKLFFPIDAPTAAVMVHKEILCTLYKSRNSLCEFYFLCTITAPCTNGQIETWYNSFITSCLPYTKRAPILFENFVYFIHISPFSINFLFFIFMKRKEKAFLLFFQK